MTGLQSLKISLLILIVSRSNENTVNTKSVDKLHWQNFTLWLEDTSIIHGNIISDSIQIKSHNNEPILYYVGKQNVDSLFYWAENLLNYRLPEQIQTCTDYIGKLRIQIRYSNILSKQVDFISICNWKGLSIETRKIDSILKLAVKR